MSSADAGAPGPRPGFGRTQDIRRPPIAAINALAAEERARGAALIDLGQAVLGLPPPPAAMQAVADYVAAHPVQRYAPDPGTPEARAAVAAHLRARKGIPEARPEQVMLTCGANQAFVNALLCVTRPGDEVVTFGPGYFDHDFAIRLAGCRNVEVGLALRGPPGAPEGFAFDLGALQAALTERTRAVVLVSPGNPTGAVISPEDLERLVALCEARGIWLVSDETYDLLTFPPARAVSAAAAGSPAVLVVASFSKVFALAAWRIGYLFGPEPLVTEAIKVQDALVVCAPVPAQHAAVAALGAADAYGAHARAVLARRRDALLAGLAPIEGLAAVPPEGATFVMARLPEGWDDVAFCTALVLEAGVVAVPGSAFGPRGRSWVRLSFGNQEPAAITEACGRIEAAWAALAARARPGAGPGQRERGQDACTPGTTAPRGA